MPLLLLVALAFGADAPPPVESQTFQTRPLLGRPVLDMRLGTDTMSGTDRPVICLEGYPHKLISIELCGNGAGFLHHDDVADIAHFRVRLTAARVQKGRAELSVLPGFGFAEVQRTADALGFQFGQADGPDPVEAAGAEASLSLKGRLWVAPQAYLVVDVNGGGAYIPAAPQVFDGADPLVAFAGITLGAGL